MILCSRRSMILLLAALLAAGCDGYKPPKGVVVTGKVVKDGKPLEVPRRDVGLGSVEVRIVPMGDETQKRGIETSHAEKDGTFKIVGAGRGVPPGKYRVAVLHQNQGFGSDALNGAFSDTKSPIEIEVPKSGGSFDVGTLELNEAGKKKP